MKRGFIDGPTCSSINEEIIRGMPIPAPRPTMYAKDHLLSHESERENLVSINIPSVNGISSEYFGDVLLPDEKIGTINGSKRSGLRKLNHVIIIV